MDRTYQRLLLALALAHLGSVADAAEVRQACYRSAMALLEDATADLARPRRRPWWRRWAQKGDIDGR